ncbi:hypothetical protein [uncultured Rhodoblastus sp.]|uniref:hypothetical protein n=1 Tax=uncultured Rhodoblastus sp. TaxID=543037 RepID=UPI0025CE62C1|nr:hypothetical protein [uncultured Rhodoblastus sp.]
MDQEAPPAPEQPATKAEPALSPEKQAQKQRLAEALRANLRRRKAQVRQRKADFGGETGS